MNCLQKITVAVDFSYKQPADLWDASSEDVYPLLRTKQDKITNRVVVDNEKILIKTKMATQPFCIDRYTQGKISCLYRPTAAPIHIRRRVAEFPSSTVPFSERLRRRAGSPGGRDPFFSAFERRKGRRRIQAKKRRGRKKQKFCRGE
jgi:hypothetical protein